MTELEEKIELFKRFCDHHYPSYRKYKEDKTTMYCAGMRCENCILCGCQNQMTEFSDEELGVVKSKHPEYFI